MILYEYECEKHGRFEEFNTIDDREIMVCPECGMPSQKVISTSHVYVDFTPGWDPAFAKDVGTKRERDRLVREAGLVRYKD